MNVWRVDHKELKAREDAYGETLMRGHRQGDSAEALWRLAAPLGQLERWTLRYCSWPGAVATCAYQKELKRVPTWLSARWQESK